MVIENGVLLKVTNEDVKKGYFAIPDNVFSLGNKCFKAATNLRVLHIPETVRDATYGTFDDCDFIKEITMPIINTFQGWSFIRSLKKVNIIGNSSREEYIVDFRGDKKYKELNFDFGDKNVVFKNKEICKITKTNDNTFVLYESGDKYTFVTKNETSELDIDKLLNHMPNYLDFKDVRNDYRDTINEHIEYFKNWLSLIESNKRLSNETIPGEYALITIPYNSKAVTDYYLNKKKLEQLFDKYDTKESNEKKMFTKMAYILGFFTGKKEDQNCFINFIEKNLNAKDKVFMSRFLNANVEKTPYNPEFRSFIMNNYDKIKNLIEFSYRSEEGFVSNLYNKFKIVKQEIKQANLDFTFENVRNILEIKKFTIHEGNEPLFETFKEYASDYSIDDFNRMQTLYEKAREISKIESKKIILTKDVEDKCKYEWLEPTNPNNYFLGNKAGCCARIGHMGEGILKESVTNPKSCNLAFYGLKGKIIGKATAYYNVEEKYILFNNAEIANDTKQSEKALLFEALIRAVTDEANALNKEEIKVEKILMGMRLNDLRTQIEASGIQIEKRINKLKKNLIFVGTDNYHTYYGDANSDEGQCVLWDIKKQKVR